MRIIVGVGASRLPQTRNFGPGSVRGIRLGTPGPQEHYGAAAGACSWYGSAKQQTQSTWLHASGGSSKAWVSQVAAERRIAILECMAAPQKARVRRKSARPKLVSQYLENVSREFVEKHPDLFRGLADGRHGIYALYRKEKLYYVGLATNLRNRLKSHLKNRHAEAWNRFSMYLTIGDDNIKELEALALRILKAPGNRQSGQIRRAENLKRRLAREVRKKQKAELNALLGKPLEVTDLGLEVDGRSRYNSKAIAASFGKAKALKAVYKGKSLRARLRRNGTVSYAGSVYENPTEAAKAACKKRSNGYYFWFIERAPGDWVRLKELHN